MTQRALKTALVLTVVGFIAMSANAAYVSSFTPTYSYEGNVLPENAGWDVTNTIVNGSVSTDGDILTIQSGDSGYYRMLADTTTTAAWDASGDNIVFEARYQYTGTYVNSIRATNGADRLEVQMLDDGSAPTTGRYREPGTNYWGKYFNHTDYVTLQIVINPGGADSWEVYMNGEIYEKTDGTDWIFTSSQLPDTTDNQVRLSNSHQSTPGTLLVDYVRWGTVPEPATMSLLALGGGLLFRRRRSRG